MFVDNKFMIESFSEENLIKYYTNAVLNIGLWESEKDLFTHYFNKNDDILDIGCGAGRTTLGLHGLGYNNITGIDFIPEMIEHAKQIAKSQNVNINYQVGDATKLEFDSNSFNGGIFSFNGFMQIPDIRNRVKALNEIRRVLKPSGVFIFTSDDRRINPEYKDFWIEEKKEWDNNQQNKKLIDFGDRIFQLPNRQMYMHFATIEEMVELLESCEFKVIEHFNRNSRYKENKKVVEFCTDCRFWIINL